MSCRSLALLLALALCAGCASAPRPTAVQPVVPANDNLNAVLWSQRALEHDLVFRQLYRMATEKLLLALDDPNWDALAPQDRDTPCAGLPPAVILDLDETVLDNSPYAARNVLADAEYDRASWAAWCQEQRARALAGALEFTRFAAEQGVAVFYVSNRQASLDAVTLANLRELGLPVASDRVFLGLGTPVEGCEQHGSSKVCRRRLVGRGHRVLMQFGDQLGDFVEPAENSNEGRVAALEPFASWVGERWFVFPNPTYGSWEPAQFGNDWSLSRTARRQAKLDALISD